MAAITHKASAAALNDTTPNLIVCRRGSGVRQQATGGAKAGKRQLRITEPVLLFQLQHTRHFGLLFLADVVAECDSELLASW